jgi:predicted kinase
MRQELIILCGIPFSGKSVLASKIAQLGYQRIDLDEVKFKIFGSDITDDKIDQAGWDKIYQAMYKEIDDALATGKSVVHDTGNFTVYERGLISSIAKKRSVPFRTVFVDTPIEVARQRLEKNRTTKERFDVSDEAFQSTVKEMEKPLPEENPIPFPYLEDTEEWVEKFVR